MPGGDRTGPLGMGPLTGRAAGYCAGYGVPGYANPIPGRGIGSGFGRGRGAWGRGFGGGGGRGRSNMFHATGLAGWMRSAGYPSPYGYAAPYGYPAPYGHPAPQGRPDPQQEKQALESHAGALQAELDMIRKRLDELEAESAAE